jgi:hypothetical protein
MRWADLGPTPGNRRKASINRASGGANSDMLRSPENRRAS